MPKPLDWIQEQSQDEVRQAIWRRMDDDRKRFLLEKYVMKDANGEVEDDVFSLTWNAPRTYAKNVLSTIGGADMQVVVESDDDVFDKNRSARIEDFVRATWDLMEQRYSLANPKVSSLRDFFAQQVVLRGPVVARTMWVENRQGKLVPDILPVDSRFFVEEHDQDGIAQCAYQTVRSAAQIESEYGHRISGKTGKVWDHWGRELETVYIDDTEISATPHGLPSVPFVAHYVSSGSLLQDAESLKYASESIYEANRELYDALNKTASIFYTTLHYGYKPAMQFETEDPEAVLELEQPPYGEKAVIPVAKGMGFKQMPMVDVNKAAQYMFAQIMNAIQQGSIPTVDYGNLSFPLSAVAISKLSAAKDQVFIPRLNTLALLYQDVTYMLLDQLFAIGGRVDVGSRRGRNVFSAVELRGDYEIKYKFGAVSPEQNIANYSVANAATAYLDNRSILENILQVKDPSEIERKRLVELGERLIPELALRKVAKAFIDAGDDTAAKLVAARIQSSIAAVQAGGVPPKAQEDKPAPTTDPVPLMDGRTRAMKAQGTQPGQLNAEVDRKEA